MDSDRTRTLEQEQADFDAMLDELLAEHSGKFVVFKDGKPESFHPDFQSAYAEGLRKYGTAEVYLIKAIEKPVKQITSLAWALGIMVAE